MPWALVTKPVQWQLSGNEEERITFTFHPALAWSSCHRGHLGWNATILPVIKPLIQPQCADSHLIFLVKLLIALSVAIASSQCITTKSKDETPPLQKRGEAEIEACCDSTFSYFRQLKGLKRNHPWKVRQCPEKYSVPLFTLDSAGNRALKTLQGISWKIAEMAC